MKNKKTRQWNRYYFTITFHSKRETKPCILFTVIAHSKEQAYMKMIIQAQYKVLDRYNLRSVKIIHVDTNLNPHDINDMCCYTKAGVMKYYKCCRNNKFVDLMFQNDCSNYNARYGVCKLNNKSCEMIHTNYCDKYIEVMLQKTMFRGIGGIKK